MHGSVDGGGHLRERNTWVPALHEHKRTQHPLAVEYLPPAAEQLPMMPMTAQTVVELHTDYTDRAKGFQLATVPIAIAFGVGALVVAAVGFSVPVFSIAALGVFWIAFLAWWLVGWSIHHVASPDGIALVQALLSYRLIRHAMKERQRRYASLHEHERDRE